MQSVVGEERGDVDDAPCFPSERQYCGRRTWGQVMLSKSLRLMAREGVRARLADLSVALWTTVSEKTLAGELAV